MTAPAPAAGPDARDEPYARLVARATHEINNALNAVEMNLTVVQLRAVPGADAGRLVTFAAAAVSAHAEVIALTRALVTLGRAGASGGCDVAEVARQVVALLEPGLRASGGTLVITAASAGSEAKAEVRADAAAGGAGEGATLTPMRTTAAPAAVRDAVAAAVLDALPPRAAAARVQCRLAWDPATGVTVEVARDGVVTAALVFPSG